VYYLIDGYNFLFSLVDSKQPLASQRQKTILFLKKQFARLHLSGSVIFDGSRRQGEESGLSYPSPLEIVYTPKGQTADEYIIEKIDVPHKTRLFTVVTNDRGLIVHCHSFRTKTLSNHDFMKWLIKKSESRKKVSKVARIETQYKMGRLLKAFEERLKEDD
jgi:predicted RNA-binding protein with PIN domain